MRGPLPRYRALVEAGALDGDPAQEAAAERLQRLEEDLARRGGFFGRRGRPRGVYLWGAVGRGKSLLMDIFFNNSHVARKRRVHFHEFMAETHERIARFRALDDRAKRRHPGSAKSPGDPMPPVAHDIAAKGRLLCFDEFQVNDVADAMILGRLFEALFARGVAIVATSNRHPDDLYKDGLNRQLFLPFIDMLKTRLDVVELAAARDYRLARLAGAPVYYAPLGPGADAAMDAAWARFISDATEREEVIEVKGRKNDV
ncbi:MAG: cell division protein ZapE, partial [Amphiplicatus sp.]